MTFEIEYGPMPENVRQIPSMGIPSDPYLYKPMGVIYLRLGLQVTITNFNGEGSWYKGYVLKVISRTDGYPGKHYIIGTEHQVQMFQEKI